MDKSQAISTVHVPEEFGPSGDGGQLTLVTRAVKGLSLFDNQRQKDLSRGMEKSWRKRT